MNQPPARGALRLEVQALRAVAVLLVVLYHLWPGRLPGGYVGVDAFFVISGFLITAHLVREVDSSGRIDLARFWARRARRLLPAAFLVLAASAAATYIWLPQIHWQQNFREIIGSGLYVENWLLASDAVDYLASENAPSTAQHYWTLSVEEQFYLVWPLLILIAVVLARLNRGRLRRSTLVAVLGAVTVASFAYSLHLTDSNPSAAYFVTPTRAWQFGAGALFALFAVRKAAGERRQPRSQHLLASLLSWLGLAGLAWSGLTFSSSTPFPGTAAVLPVASTLAIIAAGAPTGRLSPTPLMRWRPVQFLGDISYSMYLWHWPPIVVLPYVLGNELGFKPRLAILIGTILAAALTKRFVEDPVRFGTRFGIRRNSRTFAFTAVAATTLVAASLIGSNIAAAASERANAVTKALNKDSPACFGAAAMDQQNPCHNPELDGVLVPSPSAVGQDFANYPGCWTKNDDSTLKDCTFGDQSNHDLPRVVVIGDSHARALLPIFVRLAEEKQITVIAHLKGSCSWSEQPMIHREALITRTCAPWRKNLAAWLDTNAGDIDLIATTALASIQKGTHEQRIDGFAKAWNTMGKRGIPIVAVKDNPTHKVDPNDCLVQLSTIKPDSCSIPRKGAFRFDALPAAAARTTNGHALVLTKYYCTDTICPSVIGGVNVYRDKSHLTTTFTRSLAPYVYRELLELKLIDPR